MKNTFIFTFIITLAFLSCNTDDPSTDDGVTGTTPVFFPLTADSHWNYNNQDAQLGPSNDSLYVANTQTQNGLLYTNLDAQIPANAFMTQFLSDNLLRTTETQLFINGSLGSPVEGLPDITLPLLDVLLFDTEVDINTDSIIGLSTGTIAQEIMEIPVEINYSITSTMLETPQTSTEETPQIASLLTVNMEIVALIPVGPVTVPFPILKAQNVLVVNNIYSSGIGLTSSQALITYTLEDLSDAGIDIPLPENNSNASSQTIATFSIGE